MNAYSRPALRSALVLAILCGMYVASFWTEGTLSTGGTYAQQTGFIKGEDGGDTATEYYVMTVHRDDQAPWLIVAKPLNAASHGFQTHSSSGKSAIRINGNTYREIPGQTIVVLEDGRDVSIRHVPSAGNAAVEAVPQDISEISVSDLKSWFARQK